MAIDLIYICFVFKTVPEITELVIPNPNAACLGFT